MGEGDDEEEGGVGGVGGGRPMVLRAVVARRAEAVGVPAAAPAATASAPPTMAGAEAVRAALRNAWTAAGLAPLGPGTSARLQDVGVDSVVLVQLGARLQAAGLVLPIGELDGSMTWQELEALALRSVGGVAGGGGL